MRCARQPNVRLSLPPPHEPAATSSAEGERHRGFWAAGHFDSDSSPGVAAGAATKEIKEPKPVGRQRCADPEHLLLALAASDGVAGDILADLGAGRT